MPSSEVVLAGSVPFMIKGSNTNGGVISMSTTATYTGRTQFLSGIQYQTTGATAATNVTITVFYVPSGTGSSVTIGTFSVPVSAAAGTLQPPTTFNFMPALASPQVMDGTTNVGVGSPAGQFIISSSAPGSGATVTALNAWGFVL